MYSSGILRNTSSSPCPNAPQNKARPARTARREKPHTMGSMTPPPPPLFPAPQAFSSTTILRKCQPTPCSRRQHRQAGPHKRIGFLARGNQGRYSSIVPGHWTYLYGVLAGSVKYNAGLRSRTFGSRNPALRISKALCLRRIVAAFIAITVAISVTTTPPVPAAAITLATTFSVAGLHIRSRDDTFCRYRTGTLRTVASTAPTTSPLRPFPPRPDPLRPRRPP